MWFAALALLGLWLAPHVIATAGVRFSANPAGWQPASQRDEAHRRARDWATATGAELAAVYGPSADDEFQETLALLDVPGPMPSADSPEAVLQAAFGSAHELGEPTTATSQEVVADAPPIVRGRFEADGIAYHVAVGPSHEEHTVIVLAVRADEESLYDGVFDEGLEHLQGVAAPLDAFDRRMWWIGVVVGWLVVTALVWVAGAVVGGTSAGPMLQGRRVAIACVVLALIGAVVAWFALESSSEALRRAGSSREWAVVEVALVGLGAAVTVMVIAAIGQSRVRPIQSAPAGGVFAERPTRPDLPIGGYNPGPTPVHPTGGPLPPGAPSQPIIADHTELAPTSRYEPIPLEPAASSGDRTQIAPAPAPPARLRTPGPLGGDVTQIAPAPLGPGTPRVQKGPNRTAPIALRDSDQQAPSPHADDADEPRPRHRVDRALDRTLIGTGPPPPGPRPHPQKDPKGPGGTGRGSGGGGGFPPPM